MILAILLITGCEKPVEWIFDSRELNLLVVDGIITNELKSQHISLSVSNPEINEGRQPVSGAFVTVDDGMNTYFFSESMDEPGNYFSTPFQAVIDSRYHLMVVWEADTFEAWSDIEPVTPLDTLVYSYNKSNRLFRYNHTAGGQPAMIKIFYDWSADTTYCALYGSCMAQETWYILDNVDVNAVFSPEREVIYFPFGTVIVRQKYSLTGEHQEFVRSLLMETDWSGGMFDVQHGNVATNISNGGLGYFAACMVVKDTILVQ